jgi:CheY-like chemotaxis protein
MPDDLTGEHAGRPGTVLVVDPDPDVLQSTGMLIEGLGYVALRLAEADDLLETVDKEQPDLVLLEVKMPELNVAGLLAALRSSPRTSRIPVAFFSSSYELASIAARHQAWGMLTKPFGYHELARLLERALGPPPGKAKATDAREVEAELRHQFRDTRNVIAALTNYVTVLSRLEDLDPQGKAAVARLEDLVLTLEGRNERLRSYILALLGPVEPTPRGPRPPATDEPRQAVRPKRDRPSVEAPSQPEPGPATGRASSPPDSTLAERRQAARDAMLRRSLK